VSLLAYPDIPYQREVIPPFKTGDYHYDLPLKPKITFMDRDENEIYYTFDSFINNNEVKVIYCDTDNGVGETGTANILIEDSTKQLDESLFGKGKKIKFQIAKTQAEFKEDWSYFLTSYIRGFKKERPRTGQLLYELRAYGTRVIFGEREVNMKKQTSSETNSKFQLKNLVRSLIKDKTSYPFGKPTLINQIKGLSTADIGDDLVQHIGGINFELIQASSAMDRFADIAGARWFIDFTGGHETLNMSFPTNIHSGVTIKSKNPTNWINDNGLITSYFKGAWDSDSDMSQFSGFANRLISKTQIDRKEITSSFSNQGSISLSNKALAVKFQMFDLRLSDLAFILSKVGDPQSPKDRINGAVIADKNNSPTGATVATFEIPIGSTSEQTDTIFLNDLNLKDVSLTAGAFFWLVLYQRSGTNGDPQVDEANTIRWHHNNDLTSVTLNVSMQAVGGDKNKTLDWKYIVGADKGPTFCFGVFSKIRHIQEVSDRQSIKEYGLVEAQIDTSFLEEAHLISGYLESLLQFTARPRVVFNVNAVSCPDNFLFKPYQTVTLQDSLAYPTGIDTEIQRARYVFDGQSSNAFGARAVEITPMGFEDYLTNRLKCG